LSEAQTAQTGTHNSIRTDSKMLGLTQWSCFQGLELDLRKLGDSYAAEWNEELFLSAASVVESTPRQSPIGLHSEMVFADMTCFTYTKNIKPETAHMYLGAMTTIGRDVVIEVSDVVRSSFCVGFRDGNNVFEEIRNQISHGKHVVVSFENVRSLSAAFLESAIGQLYKGEIPESKLEECITWAGVSPTRKLLIERAISEAKKSKTAS
jgi:hypothetical protein